LQQEKSGTRRLLGRKHLFCNADMKSKEIREFCRLDGASEELLKTAITTLGLSARAYDRILRVSHIIADMGCQETEISRLV
jgi:magnesium chelatase family protein